MKREIRLLYVDDDEPLRGLVEKQLHDEDFSIDTADDGDSALEILGKSSYDVVILDIRMPGGSGLDVLEKFRRAAWAPKVIVFTNYAFTQYRKKCLEIGASFFFDKSTEFDQLPQALEQLRLNLAASG